MRALSVSCDSCVREGRDWEVGGFQVYFDGGCLRGSSLVVSDRALVCRHGPARSDESSVRLRKQRLDDCKALHVFDGSRTTMAGIRTAYIERNATRR